MEIFIIALAIGLSQGDQNAQNEYALRKASIAYLEQSGIKDNVEYKLDLLKEEFINEEVEFYGGFAIQVTRIAIEQKIVYKWSF